MRIRPLLLSALALACGSAAPAAAATATHLVKYRGLTITVPRSWPVYDLASAPQTCVRFDRHALYLGTPSADQRCPAHATGRTEAILIEPLTRAALARTGPLRSPLTQVRELPRAGVLVIATWLNDPTLIQRALAGAAGGGSSAATSTGPAAVVPAAAAPSARAGVVFRGRGFDACTAPSASAMSAWRAASPYRAVGVYIGGVNMACSQPNLTTSWVTNEIAAGWHLIPTYVGLQAPNNNCGCAAINPSQASAEGTAAANDAVNQAKAIGIATGNPIYDDMEGYTTGSANTPAVTAFLAAWTTRLQALGYVAGVYSSAGSGITDLVTRYGTSYPEPNDIWFAEWNGVPTVSSSYIPAADWAKGQRLHQYVGGVNQTWGGVTMNIDEDYLDGSTVGNPPPKCQATSATTTAGTPVAVQLRCSDAAGATLTYAIVTKPAHGTLGAIDQPTATVDYTPAASFQGSDSFTYRASSVNGTAAAASASVTVNP